MYRETTQGIEITVTPKYASEHSAPELSQYVFTYHVKITNLGSEPAQLIHRHWIITDGTGKTEQVKGPGVVGKQPTIQPGETFEYSSYCPLTTPTGNMRGRYHMKSAQGEDFEVKIPLFFLRNQGQIH